MKGCMLLTKYVVEMKSKQASRMGTASIKRDGCGASFSACTKEESGRTGIVLRMRFLLCWEFACFAVDQTQKGSEALMQGQADVA